ncbi:MAG: hypothetical protein NZ920_02210 [Aigarchaeota archaeon]|nr:hypothetical protein [Aigarchaeota archaeon]MDW8092560.1 hypothetical protein [Nitrososphaerota archaeon]
MGVELRSKEAYLKLLDYVLSHLGKRGSKVGDRLIELKPSIIQESKQTIITNFSHLAELLSRDSEHLARFIFKESGKPGMIEGERLVISGKVSPDEVAKLLQMYFREFVKCPVCEGVDTAIVSEKRFRFITCEVCGAKNPVRKI